MVGPLIAALGFLLFTVPGVGGSYWKNFFPSVIVLGLGMAVSVAPLTTTVMGAVSQARAGVASGINNAVARTAGLLAIAVLGLAMLHAFNARLDQHLDRLDISPEVRVSLEQQRSKLAGAEVPANLDSETESQLKQSIAESFVYGFRFVMMIAAGLALLSAVASWLMIDGKVPRRFLVEEAAPA